MHASIDAHRQDTETAALTLPMLPLVLPMTLGMATIFVGGFLATQPLEPIQFHIQVGAGAATVAIAGALAFAGLYAGALWHRAHRTARQVEQAPKPDNAPRRRALYGSQAVRPQTVQADAAALLRADFEAIAAANPDRRLEDKAAFLRRVATRCRGAALALAGVAAIVLLAA